MSGVEVTGVKVPGQMFQPLDGQTGDKQNGDHSETGQEVHPSSVHIYILLRVELNLKTLDSHTGKLTGNIEIDLFKFLSIGFH